MTHLNRDAFHRALVKDAENLAEPMRAPCYQHLKIAPDWKKSLQCDTNKRQSDCNGTILQLPDVGIFQRQSIPQRMRGEMLNSYDQHGAQNYSIFKKASFRCAAALKIMSLFWRSWGWNVTNLRSSFVGATAISNLRKKMYNKLNKTNKKEHRRNRKQLSGWRISCKLCIFSFNIFFFLAFRGGAIPLTAYPGSCGWSRPPASVWSSPPPRIMATIPTGQKIKDFYRFGLMKQIWMIKSKLWYTLDHRETRLQ